MIKNVKKSLAQLLGSEYIDAVSQGAMLLFGMDEGEVKKLADEQIDFMPQEYIQKMENLLENVGKRVVPGIKNTVEGAGTIAFKKASMLHASPIGGIGYLRLGEDGRLYLSSKSEHYHTPLGHSFAGYKLINNAKAMGITNATHNNTRGYITRLLERELIRFANGITSGDDEGLHAILDSKKPYVLNRVINLETGSLAVEAGVKMMLARFYKLDRTFPKPKYEGRIPVFFVMADNEGGTGGNYHGTTVITQTMRGLWPGIYEKVQNAGVMEICPVKINNFQDFKDKFERFNQYPFKVAGFLHEIVLMNYGAIRLKKTFLKECYDLCHENDVPVLVDEIQSCMWYSDFFLYHEYDLSPDFVVIGKGFPGGQYAASRILTTDEMDNLNQFGALVTNGQEELASLAYLITMTFVRENKDHILEIGRYYEERLHELNESYPELINCIEGKTHLSAICFHNMETASRFTQLLNNQCIDVSAHTYKAMCPPTALTKIPIIATKKMVDYLINMMSKTLDEMHDGSAF